MLLDRGGSAGSKCQWGKAKENWTDNDPDCDHVIVYPCDDCDGANPDTSTEVTVLLPSSAEQDPNVVADDVVAYEEAADDTYVCNSDYLDDKIGTVKMWAKESADIPPGWAIMNGSANAAPEGTGIDLTDRFVRAAGEPGEEGGEPSHTHDEHSVSDLNHEHPITSATPFDEGTGTSFTRVDDCTDGAMMPDEDCGGDFWGPLPHSSESNDPEYTEMIFIERIDNSA